MLRCSFLISTISTTYLKPTFQKKKEIILWFIIIFILLPQTNYNKTVVIFNFNRIDDFVKNREISIKYFKI